MSGHKVSNTGWKLLEELQPIKSKGDNQRISKLTTPGKKKKTTKNNSSLAFVSWRWFRNPHEAIPTVNFRTPMGEKQDQNSESSRKMHKDPKLAPHPCSPPSYRPVSDRILLCSSYQTWIHDPPASVTCKLELQSCTLCLVTVFNIY